MAGKSGFDPEKLDLSRPAAAAQFLKISRDILANMTQAEAVVRFLRELGDRFEPHQPELAEYLRSQALRLVPDEASRHSVRRGIPPLAQIRDQVQERLRRDEDRLLAQSQDPAKMGQARGCLLVVGFCIALLLGTGLWGVLWILGLDEPWGEIVGGVATLLLFAAFVWAIQRVMPLWMGHP